MNENCALSQQLESRANALHEQRQVQDELLNNVRILQSEIRIDNVETPRI